MSFLKDLLAEYCHAATADVEPREPVFPGEHGTAFDAMMQRMLDHPDATEILVEFSQRAEVLRKTAERVKACNDPQRRADAIGRIVNAIGHCPDPDPLWYVFRESLNTYDKGACRCL